MLLRDGPTFNLADLGLQYLIGFKNVTKAHCFVGELSWHVALGLLTKNILNNLNVFVENFKISFDKFIKIDKHNLIL